MATTNYLKRKIVDDLTGVAAYAPPALYLGLFTADPGASGSQANEIDAGGYARVSLAGKMGAADSDGLSVNTTLISFGVPTEQWPPIAYVGVIDASSAGNVMLVGAPSLPKLLAVGQPFQIPPGQLRLRQG